PETLAFSSPSSKVTVKLRLMDLALSGTSTSPKLSRILLISLIQPSLIKRCVLICFLQKYLCITPERYPGYHLPLLYWHTPGCSAVRVLCRVVAHLDAFSSGI